MKQYFTNYFSKFASLSDNNDFLKLFAGRMITNMGDSIYYIASMWLVFSLTGSSFYTGIAGFLTLFPQILEFLTGPIVDDKDHRQLLIATQLGQGTLLLSIPLASVYGVLTVELVLVIMPLVSLIEQFVYPTQNAFLPHLVDEEQLASANSLFSLAYQGIDTGFNALAGILIVSIGAVSLFFIDVVTFVFAALIFFTISSPKNNYHDNSEEREADTDQESSEEARLSTAFESYRANLVEGIQYVTGSVIIWMASRRAVLNFVNGAVMAVLPVYAAQQGDPSLYGFYIAAISAGIFIGSAIAMQFETHSFGYLIPAADFTSGFFWIIAILAPFEIVSAILFALAWVPVGITSVIFFTAIQSGVDTDMLGRVSSVNSSIAIGTMPFGSLFGGAAATIIGVYPILLSLGGMFFIVSIVWMLNDNLRTIPEINNIDFTS